MADTTQIIDLINKITALGIEFLPIAVTLAKTWSASSGTSITDLANSSDAAIDDAVAKALADEATMGYSPAPAPQTT